MIYLNNEAMSYRQSFSSIYIPIIDCLSESILNFGDDLIDESSLFIDNEKHFYGREDEPHITVAYGIHADKPEDLKYIFEDCSPFKVTLGEIDIFHRMDFDVLIIRVYSDQLHILHHQIINSIKITSKFKYYEPHITLAYIQKGKCKDIIGDQIFDNIQVKVNNLIFTNNLGFKTNLLLGNKF